MKKWILTIFLFSICTASYAAEGWLGRPWHLKRLQCPFGCSKFIRNEFIRDKSTPVVFEKNQVVLPRIIKSCASPAKPDWSSMKPVQARSYLEKWSDNEEANRNPKIKKRLVEKLGFSGAKNVLAGVVRCSDGTAFNLIVIHPRRAYLRGEENSYFELTR